MKALQAWLTRVSGAHPGEMGAAVWSFLYFFSLLAAYYVLRPLRDEMAIQQGSASLATLFTAVFVTMVVLVPVFGWLTRRFERRKLLPWLYAFFIANLLGFHEVLVIEGVQQAWVARAFFVWVSVFNLFAISVFWSFMADLFRTGQAKRLYGFISAGGTLGALCGPLLTIVLAPWLGAKGLVLVSVLLLGACIGCQWPLRRWANPLPAEVPVTVTDIDTGAGTGFQGSVWSGLTDVVKSPYLLGICGFLLLYSLLSTLLYFQQADIVPKTFSDANERTRMLAGVDLLVNGVTLCLQLFAFRKLIEGLGTRALLVVMPVASLIGYVALALAPVLGVLVVFGVVRRAGEYAISKPARETLFNVLPPDQKYRAKNVIDTLVHRTGDTASAWVLQGLKLLGVQGTQVLWAAVPLALAWTAVAWRLGGMAQARTQAQAPRSPSALSSADPVPAPDAGR